MLNLAIFSIAPAFRIVLSVIALSLFMPQILDQVDSRGIANLPVAISVNQNSLAMMALTDIRSDLIPDFESDAEQILSNWGQVTLNAGVDGEKVFEMLTAPKQPQINLENEGDLNPNKLTGMVISQKNNLPGIVLVSNERVNRPIETLQLKNVYGDWQPLSIRKQKILAAANREDLKEPQVKEKALRLIEQAIKEKKKEESRRVIVSQLGGQIHISKPVHISSSQKDSNKGSSPTGTKNKNEEKGGISPTLWKDHHERPILIAGQIQLAKGLAYTGENHLSISRVFEGETKETAKIWIRDAKFELPIKRAKGYIVAEMHDRSGLLIAYNEYDLSKLPVIPVNEYKVSDIELSLEPVKQGAIVEVISGYSYDDKVIRIIDANVTLEPFGSELIKDQEGQHVERSLEMGSDVIVKVEAKDHWPTLTRVTSGTVAMIRVFHAGMMKALVEIVSFNDMERKENIKKGIIWGVITNNGRAVAGAKVEVRGNTGPISYINNFYLPDVEMKSTSKNGMFAIIGAEDGLQSLRISYNGVQYPAQVINTLSEHVSFVEINFDKLQSVRLKVVDKFNSGFNSDISIRSLGSNTVIENIKISQDIESQKYPLSFHFLEADAGLDYEMIRVEEPLSQHFIRFPLVQSIWLRGIKARHKLNDISETGTIVGWISEEGFDVILDDGNPIEGVRLVYFNDQGQIVEKNQNPSGFIIFNVPEGQHAVTILPHSRKTVISKVLTVDTEFVSTVVR